MFFVITNLGFVRVGWKGHLTEKKKKEKEK